MGPHAQIFHSLPLSNFSLICRAAPNKKHLVGHDGDRFALARLCHRFSSQTCPHLSGKTLFFLSFPCYLPFG